MKLYCINFNNYYNRKIKVLGSISAYAAYLPSGASALTEANFNPNDGVMTEQIIGSSAKPWTFNTPDYLVCTDDNDTTIIYRWFVLEAIRLRYGQYKLKLRRDLIADHRSIFLTNPAMISKAMLSISDDGIFNPEPMTFSQIKRQEIELNNTPLERGWIVGYFAPLTADKTISWVSDTGIYAPEYPTIADIPFYDYSALPQKPIQQGANEQYCKK